MNGGNVSLSDTQDRLFFVPFLSLLPPGCLSCLPLLTFHVSLLSACLPVSYMCQLFCLCRFLLPFLEFVGFSVCLCFAISLLVFVIAVFLFPVVLVFSRVPFAFFHVGPLCCMSAQRVDASRVTRPTAN